MERAEFFRHKRWILWESMRIPLFSPLKADLFLSRASENEKWGIRDPFLSHFPNLRMLKKESREETKLIFLGVFCRIHRMQSISGKENGDEA